MAQILDLSLNPLGMNGGRLISELLDPQQTPQQFLVELRLDKEQSICCGAAIQVIILWSYRWTRVKLCCDSDGEFPTALLGIVDAQCSIM
eukprot:308952-Pelagomonas_calceolata.AAC.3